MDKDIAINVEGLGKRYNLGETVDLQRTFREALTTLPRLFGQKAAHAGRRMAQRMKEKAAKSHEAPGPIFDARDPDTPAGTFWALKDISFQVKRGEVIGIIGRNGAGKSTLLKILARITTPTTGHAEMRGRVASLLEVGTGFNPELTGRENIFLNGSIMGMRKAEIHSKFDEIVEFSGVEKFLDTPLKRYSSGMGVRLGFSVAAHLNPEIMIVDEVLAVGDYSFQQKCLGRMDEAANSGRTILFVSHNMNSILRLCSKTILLDKGQMIMMDDTDKVIESYFESFSSGYSCEDASDGANGSGLRIRRIVLKDEAGQEQSHFRTGDDTLIEIHYETTHRVDGPLFNLSISSIYGPLLGANMNYDDIGPKYLDGSGTLTCVFPKFALLPNHYEISLSITNAAEEYLFKPAKVASFQMVADSRDLRITGQRGQKNLEKGYPMRLPYEWRENDGTVTKPIWVIREDN